MTSPLAPAGAALDLLPDSSGGWGLGEGLLPCQTPAPPPVAPPDLETSGDMETPDCGGREELC